MNGNDCIGSCLLPSTVDKTSGDENLLPRNPKEILPGLEIGVQDFTLSRQDRQSFYFHLEMEVVVSSPAIIFTNYYTILANYCNN